MAFFLLAFNHSYLLLCFLIILCYFNSVNSVIAILFVAKLVKNLLTDFRPLTL